VTAHEDMTAAGERAVRAMQAARSARLTRRLVLRTAAGAGLAATAVTTAVASPALAADGAAQADGPRPATADSSADDAGEDGPVVAHVRNARTGEIDVFRGTSQVRVHDTALAAHLIRASR
jgi:hypothetical protein